MIASDVINSLLNKKINFHIIHKLAMHEGNVDMIQLLMTVV